MNNPLLLLALVALALARPQTDDAGANNSITDKPQTRVNILEEEIEGRGLNYESLGDPGVCGVSSKQLQKVSRTGMKAQKRDYPWMAVMVRKSDHFHFCGGAIITRRHFLTAAHCLANFEKGKNLVRVGEYDFERTNDTESQDLDILDVRKHADFDPGTYENDIAILFLDGKIKYTYHVLPICLPLPTQDFEGKSAVVAGWGTTSYGGPQSDILKEVSVPIWKEDECISSFTQNIYSTQFCAASYEGGEDACQGDSGGPLVTQRDDGRWITIGIVSWGIGCGEKGKPGVYLKVNKYLDWIAPRIRDV